jgi:RNA polymerase sigma factor (sigma-70 family)
MKPFSEEWHLAPSSPAGPPPPWDPVAAPPETETPPTLPAGEPELCALALTGVIGAWNALVQRHNQRVVVSLLARGVRLERAKDLAQDAWIRLIEQQRAGRLRALQLPGLAIAQAAFLALESARREAGARRMEPLDGRGEHAELADPQCNAEARLLTQEQIARAEAILSRCSPSAKKVFRLVYNGEGLSHAEVARAVGLSLQRVRQILCEVRKELRAAVEGVCHE